MAISIAFVLSSIFFILSAIHFFWGLGGKWAGDAAIPTTENNVKVMNPKFLECFIVGMGLLSFGLLVLIRIEFISFKLPEWIQIYGIYIISGIFMLRAIGEFNYVGFFKKIRKTKFGRMDTIFYSPLCLFIGVMGIILELSIS